MESAWSNVTLTSRGVATPLNPSLLPRGIPCRTSLGTAAIFFRSAMHVIVYVSEAVTCWSRFFFLSKFMKLVPFSTLLSYNCLLAYHVSGSINGFLAPCWHWYRCCDKALLLAPLTFLSALTLLSKFFSLLKSILRSFVQ